MSLTEIGVIVSSTNGLVGTALAIGQLRDRWLRRGTPTGDDGAEKDA